MFHFSPMTAENTMNDALGAIEAQLLAKGGYFETEEADVLGVRMRVFAKRPRSLRELLITARAHGDGEYLAFVTPDDSRRISFRGHERLVASTAAAFRDRFGIAKGDRVAIFAANCPEWVIAFWATVSLGAIAVGLNGWWTGAEARHALHDVAPKLLIADAKRLARFEGNLPPIPLVLIERDFESIARGDESGGPPSLPETPLAEDDPALVLFTSGTTGRPKGAVHSHRNVIAYVAANAFHGARMRIAHPPLPLGDGSPPPPNCALITSPLFHVSGLHSGAIACLAGGVKTVWPVGRFDPAFALDLISRERITGWGFTATLLHRITDEALAPGASYDTSSVRHLGGGGSPIAPRLQARAREAFPNARATLGVGYGLTECGALATLNPGEELARHPRSVGRPMPTIEVEIRDSSGAKVADGAEGEICVRSPLVMLEYWRNPEATAAAITPDRWLRTGDIGSIRERRLTLTTRRHDLILRGGENVYPVEIEQRLEEHPRVIEAAVVGVPHASLGEEVKAFVVVGEGAIVSSEDLAAWTRATLAYFKVPAHWEIRREALPRTATGKVMKHDLAGTTSRAIEDE